jgi:tripartite-type tricarboxylate transporter receptor subunit TctC
MHRPDGNSSALLPQIGNEKIRLLAVGTAQRIGAAPNIPAVAETLPGFEFSSWNGFSDLGRLLEDF